MSIQVWRWAQRMERDDIGGFVTYHDYAMLYEQMEALRSDMQRRIKIGKELTDEIERLRAQRDELAEALRPFVDFPQDIFICLAEHGGTFTLTVNANHMLDAVDALAKLEVKP